MSIPKVAICIPTYNHSQYLSLSVTSACNQSYPNTEICVSDDASTDKTPEIMAELCKQFPQIYYHRQPHNLGMRNNPDWLMCQTDAEFIVRFDSDDILEKNYVEVLVELLIKYPQAGYAHSAVKEIDADGNLTKIRRLARVEESENSEHSLRALLKGYRVSANIIMYRAEAIKKINFFRNAPSNIAAEDYYVAVKLADVGYGNVYSPKILASYRSWGGSQWSKQRRIGELEASVKIFQETFTSAFKQRNWNVKYLEYHSKQRALESATLLLNYKDLSKEEYDYILELLKNWGDSLPLRIQILLLKLTFYADLVSKIRWWKWQIKANIKNFFLSTVNRQE